MMMASPVSIRRSRKYFVSAGVLRTGIAKSSPACVLVFHSSGFFDRKRTRHRFGFMGSSVANAVGFGCGGGSAAGSKPGLGGGGSSGAGGSPNGFGKFGNAASF